MVPTAARSARGEAAAGRAERDAPFPRPASSAVPEAPQGTLGPLGCQGPLLAHIQLAVGHNAQLPVWGLLSSLSPPRLYVQPGLPLPRDRARHLLLLNFPQALAAQLSPVARSLCKAPPPLHSQQLLPVQCQPQTHSGFLPVLCPCRLWDH